MTLSLFIDILGWYGAVAIIIAYVLVSLEKIRPRLLYQFLNFTGAAGIALSSFAKDAYQPGFLNVVWMLIAVFAVGQILFGSSSEGDVVDNSDGR